MFQKSFFVRALKALPTPTHKIFSYSPKPHPCFVQKPQLRQHFNLYPFNVNVSTEMSSRNDLLILLIMELLKLCNFQKFIGVNKFPRTTNAEQAVTR